MSQTPRTSSDGGESRDWKSEAAMSHSQDSKSSPTSTSTPAEFVERDIQSNDTRDLDPERVEQKSEPLRLEDHENPLNWNNGRKCTVSSPNGNHR